MKMQKMLVLVFAVLTASVTQKVDAQIIDTNPIIRIFPVFGPPTYAPSFLVFSTNMVTTVKNLKLVPTGVRTGPTDVRLLQVLTVDDLLTTTTNFFYRQVFNPGTPWDKEFGGTVWWVVDVEAAAGKVVSMNGITATISSSDSGNLLAKNVNFSTNGYGIAAIGIMQDGTLINQSQPSATQNQRTIVAIASKSFPVSNQGNIATVVNYIAQFPDFSETIAVNVGAVTVTKTLKKGIPRPNLIPYVVMVGENKLLRVVAESGFSGTYPIQYSFNLTNWIDDGTIASGQTNSRTIQANSSPTFYMRLKP